MLQLKRAIDSDYEYARNIHHTAYKDMVITQFGEWEEQVQDNFFEKSWHSLPYDIIYVDDEPCGYCSIEVKDNTLQLREFAVDVSKQGRGIGSMLLATFKEMGKEQGKRVQLNVMKTNTRAREFYEKNGFSVYGENHFQFLMRCTDGL